MKHNDVLRDERYLGGLKEALERQYDISVAEITPATRGFYGETWKVGAAGGSYFLKMDSLPFHQKRFRSGLAVIQYLCENGIGFAGTVVKTRDGALSAGFEGALMGLFEWVDGENVETDETKAPEYQMLCQVYRLTKPGLDIPTASFSEDAALGFYEQWEALKRAPQTAENCAALSALERFRGELDHCASRLSHFAEICRRDRTDLYLTHGDAGGNFFVGKDQHYMFDWDEAMYAPLERDAWVMGCYGWARKLFDGTLRKNGIPYELRAERLAFYCYHMYFFYLGEFLMTHPISDQSKRILEYFEDGWIKSRIRFADTI